ncbi:hypothetical protein GCM10011313_25870 [Mycetocola zhadangensis]|nr:hypothetical protein GCM10011313_25870 [Mycetocola zhadangensis]
MRSEQGTDVTRLAVSADLRDSFERLKAELLTDLGPAEIEPYRQLAERRAPELATLANTFGMEWEDLSLEGGVEVTRLWPRGSVAKERSGTIVFLHGGGLIAGCRADGLDVVLEPAAALSVEVWTVEYGLAPSTRFADAVEQCLTAVDAALSAGSGPVVIAGQSAGGGLAAAVTLLDRDRTGGRLAGQLLICPMLHPASDTTSMLQFESDPLWSRISNATAWRAAQGKAEQHTGIGPAGQHERLDALPPTFLDSGSAEVFRDDIVSFASRLWAAGVPTELHVWEGGYHGFDGVEPLAPVSRQSRTARTTWLGRLLSGGIS